MDGDPGFSFTEGATEDSHVVVNNKQNLLNMNNVNLQSDSGLTGNDGSAFQDSLDSFDVNNTNPAGDWDLLESETQVNMDRPDDQPQTTIGKWGQKFLTPAWFVFYDINTSEPSFPDLETARLYYQEKERFGEGLTEEECRAVHETREEWLQFLFEDNLSARRREPDGLWNVPGPFTHVGNIRARDLRPPPGEMRARGVWRPWAPTEGKPFVLHELASWATPEYVDIRLLGTVPISAIEIWTFFPYHLRWTGFAERFVNRDTPTAHIAHFMAFIRNVEGRNVADNHIDFGRKYWRVNETKHDKASNGRLDITDYTCEHWSPPKHLADESLLLNYRVIDLADGVRRDSFPTGADKGPLTWAIEYALDHDGCEDMMLNEMREFVWTMCFPARCEYRFWTNNDSDGNAYLRHKEMIDQYRHSPVMRKGSHVGNSIMSSEDSSLPEKTLDTVATAGQSFTEG